MKQSTRVEAVLLTGTIGSGKTALAVELGDILGQRGHGTAVIDLDWLGWFHPPGPGGTPPADLIVSNLAAVWPNFRSEGARYLVMARMVQSAAEIDAIKDVLEEVHLRVVRVSAPREVIEARLRSRDTGAELEGHLREYTLMDDRLDAIEVEDLRVDNDGPAIGKVAEGLLARLGWV